ncbi:hypothetical protein JS562_52405, partial [Agrobacterium sp. S2]|nr:hypothetical protein [Agrobacterium sp. S2]
MKVFVQIPCLNEEDTLPAGAGVHPRGTSTASTNSRSSSSTTAPPTERSRWHSELGVRHFVRHSRNMGLARSFRDGVDYALAHGA